MEYANHTVKQLRQICKTKGIKNYAWKKKIELIFMIENLPTKCVNCNEKLTIERMNHYLTDPEIMNTLYEDEYTIPCEDCENSRDSCCVCGEMLFYKSLEDIINMYGEDDLMCGQCATCAKCDRHINIFCNEKIEEENWIDGELYCELYCDDCVFDHEQDEVICSEHQMSAELVVRERHYCDICKRDAESFFICKNCDYDECEQCHKPKG